MSGGLERFDIRLRFLNGPLKFQGEVEHRGPVVRLGAEPGPGELKLDGYRGLEARHATITAYDRARVEIAPCPSGTAALVHLPAVAEVAG